MTPVPQYVLPPSGTPELRVMIVDDSAVVRGLVSRWLSEHGGITVVATAANGRLALEALDRVDPDIIVLDLDMPELDGLTALPLILRKKPSVSVLIASTLTRRNADISLRCLSLGAVDYLPKPESNRDFSTTHVFRRELVLKLDAIGTARRKRLAMLARAQGPGGSPEPPAGARPFVSMPAPAGLHSPVAPRCLIIGASTGGPRAVARLLTDLGPRLDRVPILIVQHMPPIFTAVFAEHLRIQTGHQAREPFDGERLMPGTVYVAPGGRHMGVKRVNGHPSIRLDDGPPINFCRPAVDVLFREAAVVFGASALAVVLTGMGSDGTQGARTLTDAGATIIVQDEATSTVWGMPGSIARAGLATAILPLEEIGASIGGLLAEHGP